MTATTRRRCAGCHAVIEGRANKLYCSAACCERARRERRKLPRNLRKTVGVSGPVPSVVMTKSNGVLIAKVARLGYLGGPDTTVLDATPGRGKWWTVTRPPGLVSVRADFRCLPFADNSVPVIAFDPPYISTGSRATSTIDDFYDRYGLGGKNWREIRQLMADGLADCARVLTPRGRLLFKLADYTESGRKIWNTFWFVPYAEQLGLRLVDRLHHHSGGGAQPDMNLDGTPREQQGAREVASMLLVFTK